MMYLEPGRCTHFFTHEDHTSKRNKLNHLIKWKRKVPEEGTPRTDFLHSAQAMKSCRNMIIDKIDLSTSEVLCLTDSSSLLQFYGIKQKEVNPYGSSPNSVRALFITGSHGMKKIRRVWYLYGVVQQKCWKYTNTNTYIHSLTTHLQKYSGQMQLIKKGTLLFLASASRSLPSDKWCLYLVPAGSPILWSPGWPYA